MRPGDKNQRRLPWGCITAEARAVPSAPPLEDGTLVIVGGEHHKTGQGPNTNLHYQKLVEFARDHFTVTDMPYRWSTQDYTTLDDLPYIGQLTARTPNIYVATGFRKWGMTNSTAGAILLKDLIVHGDSPLAPVYDPSRFKTDPMLKNAVTVNIDVAKHLVGDKLKAVTKDSAVAPGEATVVAQDGKKIGLYKDDGARFMQSILSARTWAATWPGMQRAPGTAPATARLHHRRGDHRRSCLA